MSVLEIVGLVTVIAVALLIKGFVFLVLREFVYGWWQLVRMRAIERRKGVTNPATLRQWVRAIWQHGLEGGDLHYRGFRIPRSPFKRVGSAW